MSAGQCSPEDDTEQGDRTRFSSRPVSCDPISPDCLRSASGCRYQNPDRESGNSGRAPLAQWKKMVGGKISDNMTWEACSESSSKRLGLPGDKGIIWGKCLGVQTRNGLTICNL